MKSRFFELRPLVLSSSSSRAERGRREIRHQPQKRALHLIIRGGKEEEEDAVTDGGRHRPRRHGVVASFWVNL